MRLLACESPDPKLNFEAETFPETSMEAQKGPYKGYSPSKRGTWASMLVWGSVTQLVLLGVCREYGNRFYRNDIGTIFPHFLLTPSKYGED